MPVHPAMAMDTPDPQLIALIDDIARHAGSGQTRGQAEQALRALYDRTSGKLYGVALRVVGNREWAEDVDVLDRALPPMGGPRSLGVLGEDAVVRLTDEDASVRGAPAIAISLEPKGGIPGDKDPTGPVLFKGAALQTPV